MDWKSHPSRARKWSLVTCYIHTAYPLTKMAILPNWKWTKQSRQWANEKSAIGCELEDTGNSHGAVESERVYSSSSVLCARMRNRRASSQLCSRSAIVDPFGFFFFFFFLRYIYFGFVFDKGASTLIEERGWCGELSRMYRERPHPTAPRLRYMENQKPCPDVFPSLNGLRQSTETTFFFYSSSTSGAISFISLLWRGFPEKKTKKLLGWIFRGCFFNVSTVVVDRISDLISQWIACRFRHSSQQNVDNAHF